ncbi:hypothetical protein BJF78_15210 [Pseudonocardia sp. CNS-139]|nr:hypothetical protein BJF78_15210 [Pseudonocardia sp. CNS-139]
MSYCRISSPAFTARNRSADGSPVNATAGERPCRIAASGAATNASTIRHAQKPGMIRRKRCHANRGNESSVR